METELKRIDETSDGFAAAHSISAFLQVFAFVFDQPWRMLHDLFQPVATLLGKNVDEIHMSLSATCQKKLPTSVM